MRIYLLKIFFIMILVLISVSKNADGSTPESSYLNLKLTVNNEIDVGSKLKGASPNLVPSKSSDVNVEPANKIKMLLLAAANGENYNVQYIVSGNSTRDNEYNEMIDYYTEQFRKINVELIDNACSGQSCKEWISGVGSYPTHLSDAISATNGNGENTIMEFSFGINDWRDLKDVQSFKNRLSNGIGLYLTAKPEATVMLTVPVTTGNTERGVILTQAFEEMADSLGLLLVDVTVATAGVHGNSAYYKDNTHPNKWGSRRIVNYITDQILPSELYSVMTLTEVPQQDGWMSIEEINAGLDIRLEVDDKYELKQLLFNAAIGINNDVKYIVSGPTRDNSFNEMIAYYKEQFAKINVELIDNSSHGQSCDEWINKIGSYESYLFDAINASDGKGENTILEFSFGANSDDQSDIKAKLKEGINLFRNAKPEAKVILVTPLARDDTSFQNKLSKIYEELSTELGLFLIDGVFCTKVVHGNSKYYKDGTHPNKWGSRRIVNYITDQILPSELYSGMTLTEAPQQTGWLSIDEINIGLDIRLKNNSHLPKGKELLKNNYFDYGLSYWGLNGESLAELSIDYSDIEGKNSALVHVNNNTSAESWKIQLRQLNIEGGIKEGAAYHIQFIAQSNKTVNNIFAVIQQIHGSFNDIYSKEIFLEANTQVTIIDTFLCNETDTLVEWSFNLGTASVSDVNIWFDAVHLIELDEEVSIEEENRTPVKFELSQNYPNPFNPTTTINFKLRVEGMIKLVVYNSLGQEVKVLLNENMRAGLYSVPFDGSSLTSGVYFYKLQSSNQVEVKKMLLLK